MKLIFFVFAWLSLAVFAEEEEGHSIHGEVFNEGPRQAAVRIEGTGQVDFPVTTQSKEAQAFFNQGIGQLHGYWDFEAERSFRQAAALDPDCAMAYWGMAMANFKNVTRARGFIEEAAKRRDKASEKDKLWINGLAAYFDSKGDDKTKRAALVDSLRKIMEKFPGDLEAKAFHLRQIYQNSRKGVPLSDYDKVNQLAEDIFKVQPLHPAHHYVIHLWDNKTPANALKSAEVCGPAAPAIAHMWHMPGHTYSKLQRYREAVWYQEASARVDHAHTMRYQILPDQIHNFAHNNEWLVRNLHYLGRCRDAISLSKNMIELPRRPKFSKKDDDSSYDAGGSSWQLGRQRLVETLFRFEKYPELLALQDTSYLAPDEKSLKNLDLQKYYAIARFETGDTEGGNAILTDLSARISGGSGQKPDVNPDLKESVNEVTVYAALNAAPKKLDQARELLPKLKKLSKERQADLWHRIGDQEKALKCAQEAVVVSKNQVLPLALRVQMLHAAGKMPEAKKDFALLREVAGEADPDLPVLQKLAAIGKEFGYPEGWQLPAALPSARPHLDSLGPFRWCPPPAPDFALKNSEGKEFRLSDRAGKNTLVIFFLGKGCSHCMEQLNEFAPLMAQFQTRDTAVWAVSSDTPQGLAETFLNTGDKGKNPFPFPLLSDADLKIFKEYRAFDDFEGKALHGTFFIDGDQKIRWQDISYEPFMYSKWLLEECDRLLHL